MPRLGGRPGGASSALRLTLDSERSPSVHYANWKETMLLQRQLTTLTRTEKALLHGITVDQKVASRRFQNKLQRSKIANARMWNDKETEIELRDAGMRRLHSESHLFEDTKVDFLSKLEKRPYSTALPGRTRICLYSYLFFHNSILSGASTSGNEKNPRSPRTVILRQRAKVRSHTVAGIIQSIKQTSSNTTPARESDTKSSTDYKNNDALDDDANEKWAAKVSSPNGIERKTPNKSKVSPTADIFSITRNIKNPNSTPDNEERNSAGPGNDEETKSSVDTNHNLLCTEKQKAEGDMTASPKNPNESVADTTTKRNPRNRIRPGQSTFPPQQIAESENKDQEGNATEQSYVLNTDLCKLEPEKTPEIAPSEIENVEMLTPVRPRNPRNRIRPGHSTFTADTKPIPPAVPTTVPDNDVTEPLSGNQHTSESKHQVSFMKTCLSTNEQEKRLPITKDQNQPGLSGDILREYSKELNTKPSRGIQRMRSRPLKLQASGPGSLFTEHKRPDFCRIRLTAMKNLNYDTRVRAFCEKVEELGESAAHCDYYSAKMQEMVAGQKKFVISELANVSGPSEEDYRRHSGNTAIPCITLKTVRMGEQTAADTGYYSFLAGDLDFHSSKSAPVCVDEIQQEV